MATDNEGVIGFSESRENYEAMKKYYTDEMKAISKQQSATNKEYRTNRWKVKIGSYLATEAVLAPLPMSISWPSALVVGIGSAITRAILKTKNIIDNFKYKKQKKKLEADFINGEGVFQSFTAYNNTECELVEANNTELAFQK